MFRRVFKIFILLFLVSNTHSIVLASPSISDDFLTAEVNEFSDVYRDTGFAGLYLIEQDELKNETLKNLIRTAINKPETIQAD